MRGLKEKIERRIAHKGPGWAFTRKDFRDLAPSGPVGVILSRLAQGGIIRRIGRGLYDCPGRSRLTKEVLPPRIEQTARALARKFRWTIVPEGAMAANLLGLSRQVPARIVYLSDGPEMKIQAGKQTLVFRHARPRDLHMKCYSSRLIAQALRFLGKSNVGEKEIRRLRSRLSRKDRARFVKDARFGTDWIYEVARKITRGGLRG